jgi:hypothetical protein
MQQADPQAKITEPHLRRSPPAQMPQFSSTALTWINRWSVSEKRRNRWPIFLRKLDFPRSNAGHLEAAAKLNKLAAIERQVLALPISKSL